MSFNYDILNQITNQDFKMSMRTLQGDCQSIKEKYDSGDLRACCVDVRKANESILRYMYGRLVGRQSKMPTAGSILNDNKFLSCITDTRLIYVAKNVQRIGNLYAHPEPYQDESEDEYNARMKRDSDMLVFNAEEIIKSFEEALQLEIKFINENISGVRGNLTIHYKTRINNQSGKEESVLEADLSDVADRKDYQFIWRKLGQATPLSDRGRTIRLQAWMADEIIVLEAKHTSGEQSLSAQYGPVKKDEIISAGNAPVYVNQGEIRSRGNIQDSLKQFAGEVVIERSPHSNNDGEISLVATVKFQDSTISLDDITYRWGFVKHDGTLFELSGSKNRLWCTKGKSLSKTYRCEVRCKGYSNFLTGEYGPLTEDDFAIPLFGVIGLDVEVCKKLEHKDEIVLKASFTKNNINGKPNYTWIIDGNEQIETGNDSRLPVTEARILKTFQCKITHPSRVGYVLSEPFVLTSEDYTNLKATIEEKDLAPTVAFAQNDAISVGSITTKPEVCKSISSQENTSAITVNNGGSVEPDTFKPKQPDSVVESVPQIKNKRKPSGLSLADKPAEIVAPKFKCFDSNVSRLHYFVANRDDCYATNALEYLDYNAFLYTLLKEQGYQRVVIVGKHSEDKGSNYPVITYDVLSQVSFLKPEEFETRLKAESDRDYATLLRICSDSNEKTSKSDNPIRSQMGGRSRKVTEKAADLSVFGKKVIRTIIKGTGDSPAMAGSEKMPKETFESFVMTKIVPAMTSGLLKTAIVLPLELFADRNNLWDKDNDSHKPVVDMLRSALAVVSNNVMIVSADREDDFQNLFKDPDQSLSKAFSFIDSDINAANTRLQSSGEPLACSNAFVTALSEKGRIHIASQVPGIDEIANLLLATKLKAPDKFSGLAFSKVYALAEFISVNCCNAAKTQETFSELNNNTWFVGELQNLAVNALQDEAVINKLIAVANELWDRPVVPIKALKSTYVERIYATVGRAEKSIAALPLDRSVRTRAEKQAENEVAMTELNKMIGLSTVKDMLKKRFAVASSNVAKGPGHYIFSGNPGTGKTVVARLVGEILRSQGLLRKGHLVEAQKSDLVSNHVGESALFTRRKCEEALDGVLFIDEAYQLVNTDKSTSTKFSSSFDEEAYTTLLAFMENNRSRLCVICAGYPAEMEAFRNANPGMARRIPKANIISFPDYSAEELREILNLMINEDNLCTTTSFKEASASAIEQMWDNRDSEFGNAGDVRNFLDECKDNASLRMVENQLPSLELSAEDIPSEYAYENLSHDDFIKLQASSMKKLDGLIGLANVKQQLKKLILTQAASRNKREPGHYIFAGNPGTGKTVVARMVGEVLKAHKLLRKGHTIEVSIDDLVAEYQGQTAIKTKNQCRRALDGVLFVDEAYALVNTDDSYRGKYASPYCEEAYTTIMKFMTDNAPRICVIFAGYKDKMELFEKANDGMHRRIRKTIEFDDYTGDELMQILTLYAERESDPKVELSGAFTEVVKKVFGMIQHDSSFGNAGGVIKFLEESIGNAIVRLSDSGTVFPVEAITLLAEDIPEEYRGYLEVGTNEQTGEQHDNTVSSEKISEPTGLSLLSRNVVDDLPDPYQDADVSNAAFGDYCINTVARIETEFGTATAFVITPDGYAITCAHSVAQRENLYSLAHKTLKASFPNGREYSFRIINTRPDLDMALIKIDAQQSLPYLKLASEERQIVFGEKWALYGYPHSREGIMSYYGHINSRAEHGKAGELGEIYYIDGDARPGNSGGPIVAETDGCVIGILRGALGESEKALQNYMKPIKYFWKEFLK